MHYAEHKKCCHTATTQFNVVFFQNHAIPGAKMKKLRSGLPEGHSKIIKDGN